MRHHHRDYHHRGYHRAGLTSFEAGARRGRVEKPHAIAASNEKAAKRAKTAAAATESATQDAAQAAAHVSELECDFGTATTDLATTGRKFSQVMNQLQVDTEEALQLCDTNAKLS
jgi:hypothetical protein